MFGNNYYTYQPQIKSSEITQPKEKIIVLDGHNSGITAYIFSEERYLEPDRPAFKGRKAIYFTNYEILESKLLSIGYTKLSYRVVFIINITKTDSYVLGLEDVYYNQERQGWEGTLEDANGNYFPVLIKPSYVNSVSSIGYIVNNQSNAKMTINKKVDNFKTLLSDFNKNKFKEIFNSVKDSVGLMSVYRKYDIYFKVNEEEDKIVIGLRGTTGRIVITSILNIIDINEKRKKTTGNYGKQIRCLPFNKTMNKHGALYVYTTVDINETEYVKDRLYHTLIKLIEFCQDSNPQAVIRYERVEFSGYINLEE